MRNHHWFIFLVAASSIQLLLATAQAETPGQIYDRMVRSHGDDPQLRPFQKRLEAVEQIERMVLESIEASRDASMDDLLGDLDPFGGGGEPRQRTQPLVHRAADLIESYTPLFETEPHLVHLEPSVAEALRAHYKVRLDQAQRRIAEQGSSVVALSEERFADVVELCAVLPLLHVDDEQWTEAEVEMLAPWLRGEDALVALERMALRDRRLRTAYQLATYREDRDTADLPSYQTYLQTAADDLRERGQFHTSLYLLRTARDRAIALEMAEEAAEARFALAELLASGGHSQLAAEELRPLLADHEDPMTYGRAGMLRLKHLYEAQQYDMAMEEADRLLEEERTRLHRPQILYITWVTARRQNEQERADTLQERFLKDHPQHPLGADMHFASATQALVRSDYGKALRHLEIIEYRYPDYQHMRRVVDLQKRLQDVVQP